MPTMPSVPLPSLDGVRYRLDERAGRLVDVTNALNTQRLQNLDAHLLSIVARGDRQRAYECVDFATAIDWVLKRPVGTTTGPLYAAINAMQPKSTPTRVPTARDMRELRKAEAAERRASRQLLGRLVGHGDRSR